MTAKKLNILIVDDEPLARNRLQTLCNQMECVNHVDMASGGVEALALIEETVPNILLLDVDMPDITGMDVANHCREMESPPEIIFTTAHSKYAVQAFRLEATDYLLKPVKQALLKEALGRVIAKPGAKSSSVDHRLWVQDGAGAIQIRTADIERIEADRDYMRICLEGRSYLVHEPMGSLIARLPKDMFIRIHRSTAIRANFIKEIRRERRRQFVVLKNGCSYSIGPSYVPLVTGMSIP
ncbi:hypothetical protein MNBD_ALPHA04-776 [hydrothermal vent metagenome]|uniref:Two-component transcriptional response regulator, LuxR family n=1 Tax=hydrothermal vent metagenome TaxID=652676 RepID=A0A3B0SEJ6_9ZZZZ